MSKAEYGRCPACQVRQRLLSDGTVGYHERKTGRQVASCPGTYEKPVPEPGQGKGSVTSE